MSHSNKKVGVLATATSTVGAAVASISNGAYVEGAVLLVIGIGLFVLYERYQVKEIAFNQSDAQNAADVVSDTVDSVTDTESNNNSKSSE